MEWESTLTIKYENNVAKTAVDFLKKIVTTGGFDEKYGYKRKISADFCVALDEEEFDEDTIELWGYTAGAYNPYDTTKIMKVVLEKMAKMMPDEPFSCTIECSSTYDDSSVDANYNGEVLHYSYSYKEIGWNELVCDECGCECDAEDLELNDNGGYTCPECGEDIYSPATFEEESFDIAIK